MLEKFSASAIQALNAAREEALRLEFSQVDADHLLLGLVHERQGLAARALQKLGVEQRKLRLAVEHLDHRAGPAAEPAVGEAREQQEQADDGEQREGEADEQPGHEDLP